MKNKTLKILVICLFSLFLIGCSNLNVNKDKTNNQTKNTQNQNVEEKTNNIGINATILTDEEFLKDDSEKIEEKSKEDISDNDLKKLNDIVINQYNNKKNFGQVAYLKSLTFKRSKRKEYLDKLNQYNIAVFYCILDKDTNIPEEDKKREIILSKKTKDSEWKIFRERILSK